MTLIPQDHMSLDFVLIVHYHEIEVYHMSSWFRIIMN